MVDFSPVKGKGRQQFQMNGRWMPNSNPLHVGAKNFVTVQNVRPTDTGYETVEGYSKINTTLIDTPVNIHHFSKNSESHVVAKVNNAGTYELYENTTAIPSQGDFSATLLATVASGLGSFANGPRGTMFYADGTYGLVWGGNEIFPELFLQGDDTNNTKDFTDNLTNDLTSKTTFVGEAGIDAYTVLMAHMDGADGSTTFTDSSTSAHTITAGGGAAIDTDYYKFTNASGYFDSSALSYISIPDHANFYFDGAFTIDTWIRFSSVALQQCIYFQGTSADYVAFIQDHELSQLHFIVMTSSTLAVHRVVTWAPSANTWYHLEIDKDSSNNWYIFVNGTLIDSGTDSSALPNVAATVYIGSKQVDTIAIDYGNTGHAFTYSGNATQNGSTKKYGTGSLYLDGTGDYLSTGDHSDYDIGSQTNFMVECWVKHTDHAGQENYISHHQDGNNRWHIFHEHGTGLRFQLTVANINEVNLTGTEIADTNWHHVLVQKEGNDYGLYLDGSRVAYGTYAGTPDLTGTLYIGSDNGAANYFDGYIDEMRLYHGNPYSIDVSAGSSFSTPTGPHASDSSTKLLLRFEVPYFNGHLDEFRISKGVARHTTDFNVPTKPYAASLGAYFYVCSPFKLNGVKPYIQVANIETSTVSGAVWTGSSFSSLSLTDGTSSGGITFAQTGSITWDYSEDPQPYYINGKILYVYRFALSAGTAEIYKLTVSAPLQPIRDVWNESPRTCISFQVNDGNVYEDFTFPVESKDSTETSLYAADIGGLNSSDALIAMFDDRTMAIKFDMVSSKVNAAANTIGDVLYWNGSAFVSVGYFNDGTLNSGATISFANSGTLTWNPPDKDNEQPREIFGVKGYIYRIEFANATTLTADTSIDLVTGVAAPLDMSGYDMVGTYNRRALLVSGNRIDYSQTDTPWVFNGVDSSDDGRLSLYFGDDNDIVATTSLFNRYGSNLIETLVVFKKNSMALLTGSQPYSEYNNPFVVKDISSNIGCAAPLTVESYQMEIPGSDSIRMSVVVWLDFSGPYFFTGAEPSRIQGVEKYFDPAKTGCVNYSYIDMSFGYIDSVHDQWNLLIPTGAATVPNTWLVYDFRHKKWFEKVPATYPTLAGHVVDVDGARYNYGFLSTGQMLRLDHNQTWDGTAISQVMKTGYFSPPAIDEFGMWSRSEIRTIKLISEKVSEAANVVTTLYNDGVLSSHSVTTALNSSGIVAKNDATGGNVSDRADYFQVNFAASTSTSKWVPLVWGYKYRYIREE